VRIETRAPAVDLTLSIEPEEQSWRLELEYDTSRFDVETAEEVCEHLHTVLMAMIDDPEARVRDLPIMTEQKRRWILSQWNETRTAFPRDASVPSVFADVARRDPKAVAVTDGDRRLRYGDLDRISDSLAARLAALGAGAKCPVGILLPRSTETIVAMLAALKIGAAYVPLDPTHPAERLTRILADAGVGVLVGAPGGGAAVKQGGLPVVAVDMDVIEEPLAVEEAARPLDVAYIMYTSGSTGEPKGVAVPNRAILRLVVNTDYVRLGPGDVVAHVSNTAFDAATFEVWGALLNGASLLVLDQETVLSPVRFAEVLRSQKVTTLFLTTAFFNLVSSQVPGIFKPLRDVLFGGEAVDPAAVRAVLAKGPPARLLHVYGPTEVTTFATWHEVKEVPADAITVPIGQPIANTTAHVLDARGRPVPINVPGELHLGGDGVALGYVGRAKETRQRFVPDPFSSDPDARLYRTGDRVRRRADGAIEFLGRNDRQIKIRGFRIEPGEIESTLLEHESVAACVVDLWESDHADRRLAAWVVAGEEQFDSGDLRYFLQERLPAYMIPSRYIRLDTLPMTANGKIDRGALPDPATVREREIDSPPSSLSEAESTLLEIWREVLDLKKIGVHEDFFDDLGGNSLLAVHLFSLIEQKLGVQMPLEALFRSPTIAQLAEEVGGSRSNEVGALYPLQGRGNAPPLFCVHGAGGHLLMYREFARHLGPDRPVYGFALNRIDASGELPATVEAMAERYLEELRRFRPEGPYHLSGYSFGGLVAWEMACRLEAAGDEVGLLAMFDATRETPARFPRRERAKRAVVKLQGSIAGNARRLRAQPLAEWQKIADEKVLSLRARWRVRTRRGIDASRHGDLFALCRHAHRLYRARPYGGRLTYFYAAESFDERKSFIWRELAGGGVRLIAIPARHTDLFASQAEVIAARVRESLEEIEAESDGYVGSATDAARKPHFIDDAPTLAAEIPGGNGAAPIGSVEKAMASLWEEILEIPSVSREDRFFTVGGHSLMAVRLVVAIEKKWGIELPIAAVFDSPTLSELALLVSGAIERRT
jgi:amino acid adenylation domain-containing protein